MSVFVFDKSLSAAVMIIAIVTIRALALHKLPKKTFLILWGVVVCHLVIPFSFKSPFTIYTGIDVLKQALSTTKESVLHINPPNTTNIPSTKQLIGIEAQVISHPMLTVIWLSGMFACALFFIVTYIRCRREFETSLPVDKDFSARWLQEHHTRRRVEIRQSDKIKAPLTYGVFRPVVLLPKTMDWTNETRMKYILTHEFVHIRRFDALSKLLLAFTLSVYWFNPLVWVMYVLANRDIEISCDETVVRTLGETTKSAYAMTLIGMEENKSRLTSLFTNFSKHSIEERIVSIMKMRKTTVMGMGIALALIIAIPVVFAASPVGAHNNDQNSASVLSATEASAGLTKLSVDGGETWMGVMEYQKDHPASDIVWWTAEEYQKWLDQEKDSLELLVNAPGWSQARIDNAIQRYEMTLESIKNGAKISKTVDGNESVGYGNGELGSRDSNAITAESLKSAAEGTGLEATANSFDPSVRYSTVLSLENGDIKDLGLFATKQELNAAVKAFCAEQVKAGKMTRQEADGILNKYN